MTARSLQRLVRVATVLALWLLPAAARADVSGWTRTLTDDGFWATNAALPGLRVELITHGGYPEFHRWEPVAGYRDLWRLDYFAGSAGTSVIVDFKRTALIDVGRGRVLGDGIVALQSSDGAAMDQPRWEWQDRFVVIHDPDWGAERIQVRGPWFEDHAVPVEQFADTTPVSSYPEEIVPRIRDALSAAAGEPVNFAGRYRLAVWGCGSLCTAGGILDRRTGAVAMLPFAVHRPLVPLFEELEYRADSRLLVATGSLNEERDGTFLFLWNGSAFVELP